MTSQIHEFIRHFEKLSHNQKSPKSGIREVNQIHNTCVEFICTLKITYEEIYIKSANRKVIYEQKQKCWEHY